MSNPSQSETSSYEHACDQAIAMCNGNLRSTIKALIMANEYLEAELEELQTAIAAVARRPMRRTRAATPPDRSILPQALCRGNATKPG